MDRPFQNEEEYLQAVFDYVDLLLFSDSESREENQKPEAGYDASEWRDIFCE